MLLVLKKDTTTASSSSSSSSSSSYHHSSTYFVVSAFTPPPLIINSKNKNSIVRGNNYYDLSGSGSGSGSRSSRMSTHLLAAGAFKRKSKSSSSPPASPLVEEALGEYKFKFRPENELPGTKGRPMIATSEKQARRTFNELARLYGDEPALEMVKIQPIVLCFQSKNFEPCLQAWTEQFGLESAQKMVNRNPGLLGVSPQLASQPAEASMALSYVVAVTRPSVPKFVALLAILSFVSSSSTNGGPGP